MKEYNKHFLSLLAFIICIQTGICQTADTVIVSSDFTNTNIGTKSYIRTGEDYISVNSFEVWKKANTDAFWLQPGKANWMMVVLKNKDSVDHAMKLYFNNVQAGIIRLYIQTGNRIDSGSVTGSLVPAKERASADRMLSVPFTLKSGVETILYAKIYRKGIGITITPVLVQLPAEAPQWPDFILIIALTVIFLIMIAAAFVWWFQQSSQITWFFLYIFFGFFYTMAATGFGSMYLWSSFPRFEENAAVFLGALSTAALLFFSSSALKLYTTHSKLHYYIITSAIIYAMAGVSGYLFYTGNHDAGKFSLIMFLPYLLTLSSFLILLIMSVLKGIKQGKVYWWFTAIFSSFFIMAVFLTFLELGLVKFNYLLHPLILSLGALPQMLLALIYLIYKTLEILKQRAVQVEHERLAGQQVLLSERLRISQELHDEVGATLSGISMYSHLSREQIKNERHSEVENSLRIIQQNAGDMVNKLGEIVWFTNPGQDSLLKLAQRLEEYVFDMAAVKNIQVKAGLVENMANIELPAETRRNIYLLFKETINNAVKYSDASLIELNVKVENGFVEITLQDNGVGFDIEHVKSGNGLINMKQRAKEAGAGFSIESVKGKGTRITVSVKIP